MTTTHPGVVTHAKAPARANVAFVVAELANQAAILLARVKEWPRDANGNYPHDHPEIRRLRCQVQTICESIVHCAGVPRSDYVAFLETRQFVYGRISANAVMWADAAYLRLPRGYVDEIIRDAREWARKVAR